MVAVETIEVMAQGEVDATIAEETALVKATSELIIMLEEERIAVDEGMISDDNVTAFNVVDRTSDMFEALYWISGTIGGDSVVSSPLEAPLPLVRTTTLGTSGSNRRTTIKVCIDEIIRRSNILLGADRG